MLINHVARSQDANHYTNATTRRRDSDGDMLTKCRRCLLIEGTIVDTAVKRTKRLELMPTAASICCQQGGGDFHVWGTVGGSLVGGKVLMSPLFSDVILVRLNWIFLQGADGAVTG